MKKLIINTDDFGNSRSVNYGIIDLGDDVATGLGAAVEKERR